MTSDSRLRGDSVSSSPNPPHSIGNRSSTSDDSTLPFETCSLSPNPSMGSGGGSSSPERLLISRITGSQSPPYYYGTCYPDHPMGFGGPYPNQPSYYPPPPPVYPVFDASYSDSSLTRICLCRLTAIFIFLFIVISISTYILDLIYRPRDPIVLITSVSVSYLTIIPSSTIITSELTVTFNIENPNKQMDLSFSFVDVDTMYKDKTIGTSPQPDHRLASRSEKVVVARVVDVDNFADQSTIQGIQNDMENGGVVEFQVTILSTLSFSKIIWFPKLFYAYCPGVKVQFANKTTSGGRLIGPPILCNILK